MYGGSFLIKLNDTPLYGFLHKSNIPKEEEDDSDDEPVEETKKAKKKKKKATLDDELLKVNQKIG